MRLHEKAYKALYSRFGEELNTESFLRRHKLYGIIRLFNNGKYIRKNELQQKTKKLLLLSKLLDFLLKQDYPFLLFKGPVLSQLLYGDPTVRDYSDIDIFVDLKDLRADRIPKEILQAEKEYSMVLQSRKRKELYFRLGHDFGINLWQNIKLEWHWRLFSNRFFLRKDFSQFNSNAKACLIGGKEIRTFSWNDYAVYLAIHGAVHQWSRLLWLYDYYVLIHKEEVDWEEVIQQAHYFKQVNALAQAGQLLKHVFSCEIPEKLDRLYQPYKHKFLVKEALRAIELPEERFQGTNISKFRILYYQMRLKFSARYWWEAFWRLRTHPSDWEMLKLPDALFFMYYILRPFFLLTRMLRKNK